MVSANLAHYPEIFDDKTLYIIGAQGADDIKYKGKEQTVYIGRDSSFVSDYVKQKQQENKSVENTDFEINEKADKQEISQEQENKEEQTAETSTYTEHSTSNFSVMSEEEYNSDETKMDFVPEIVKTESSEKSQNTDSEAENVIENENTSLLNRKN